MCTAATEIYTDGHTLSLPDPLPSCLRRTVRPEAPALRQPPRRLQLGSGPIVAVLPGQRAVDHLALHALLAQRQADPRRRLAAPPPARHLGLGEHPVVDQPRSREAGDDVLRADEHTAELQSLKRNSYDVFCFKNKK